MLSCLFIRKRKYHMYSFISINWGTYNFNTIFTYLENKIKQLNIKSCSNIITKLLKTYYKHIEIRRSEKRQKKYKKYKNLELCVINKKYA